jgi:hypothetical protein
VQVPLGTTVEIEVGVEVTKTKEAADVESDSLRIKRPNGELDEPSVKHEGIGSYLCTYDPQETGTHWVVFIGKGDANVTGPARFKVIDPGVSID